MVKSWQYYRTQESCFQSYRLYYPNKTIAEDQLISIGEKYGKDMVIKLLQECIDDDSSRKD